jgi:hypothetical protein
MFPFFLKREKTSQAFRDELHRFYRSSKLSKHIRRLEKISPNRSNKFSLTFGATVESHSASPMIPGNFFDLTEIQNQNVRSNKSLSYDFSINDELTGGLLVTVREKAATAKLIGQTRTGILYPSDESHAHNEGYELYKLVNEACDTEFLDIPFFSTRKKSPCRQPEDDNDSLSTEHKLGEDQLWQNMQTICQNFVDIPDASFLCKTVHWDI